MPVRDICILGVYHGRDIAYLAEALRHRGKSEVRITGVDLFDDVPGADWPEEKLGLTWEQAGFGQAPSLDRATSNLTQLGLDSCVDLHKGSATDFLAERRDAFDVIYIDISHDYESTRDAITMSMQAIRPSGWLCGDDYSDLGTWGVKRGVNEIFRHPQVYFDWIWLAKAAGYSPSANQIEGGS